MREVDPQQFRPLRRAPAGAPQRSGPPPCGPGTTVDRRAAHRRRQVGLDQDVQPAAAGVHREAGDLAEARVEVDGGGEGVGVQVDHLDPAFGLGLRVHRGPVRGQDQVVDEPGRGDGADDGRVRPRQVEAAQRATGGSEFMEPASLPCRIRGPATRLRHEHVVPVRRALAGTGFPGRRLSARRF